MIKVLNKYFNSRLRGCLIRDMDVYKNGRVVVNAENGDKKVFYIDPKIGHSDDMRDYSADCIICAMQGDPEIYVTK
jgi:hypothetical protein